MATVDSATYDPAERRRRDRLAGLLGGQDSGDSGRPSKSALERRRRLIERLQAQDDGFQATTGLGVLAKAVTGGFRGYQEGKLAREEAASNAATQKALMDALGGWEAAESPQLPEEPPPETPPGQTPPVVVEPAPGAAPASAIAPARNMVPFRDAIAGVESAGSGDYSALGPVTRKGDRAYGRYQIMGNNLPEWTQAALGRVLTPEQFIADPQAQDAVFDHRFGSYLDQHGNPQDAASRWLTGRPLAEGANLRDQLGTSGAEYAQRVSAALPADAMAPQAAPAPMEAAPRKPTAAPGPIQLADASGDRKRTAALIRALMADEGTQAFGQELLRDQLKRDTSPGQYGFTTLTQAGQVLRTDPRTGQVTVAYQGPTDARGDEYGLTPFFVQGNDGVVRAYQPSKKGGAREIELPSGGRIARGTSTVDQGTQTTVFDTLTGAPVASPIAKDVAGAAAAKARGEATAEAALNLGGVVERSNNALDVIGQLRTHPGREKRTGLWAVAPAIPGTEGQDFDTLLEQAQGQNFLSAYDQLRGAGAITEQEGRAAKAAMARLNPRQSKEAFDKALTELEGILQRGMERARAKAAGGASAVPAMDPAAGGWTEVAPGVRIRPKGQ